MSLISGEQRWVGFHFRQEERQVHSWETEVIGLEERDIATKEAIMVDDMFPL